MAIYCTGTVRKNLIDLVEGEDKQMKVIQILDCVESDLLDIIELMESADIYGMSSLTEAHRQLQSLRNKIW